MTVEVKLLVHGQSQQPVSVKADVSGEKMAVTTQGWEVELVSTDPRHGTVVLRFVGKEAELAKKVKSWKIVGE